ncbi:unnamed protein product [Scytosiphon promiscuus]
MSVDDLIDQLASLTLRSGRVPPETTKKLQYQERGECTVKQLEAHLARVQLVVSKAVSPKKLGDAAKQDGRALLKIAQAGLRNTSGGLDPLRLAYEASRTLLPLSPFIAAADLTMERLWYKVVSRSVELRDFKRGLHASAFLQICLDRREEDDLIVRGGRSQEQDEEEADSCLLLGSADGDEVEVRLRAFASPGASGSMALAKLMGGASLNACRCCLEVGSREALRLMVGELGRVAGRWVERVGELGDDHTADSYRGLLFKQLWLGCAALEKPSLSAKPRECLVGRQTALGVLLTSKNSWSPDVFVSHSLRAAMALQESSAGDGASVANAAQLSAFCLEGLSRREGRGWPAGVDDGGEESGKLHASWVEWLQYSAGLHQKAGQAAEAQRLLRLAYEYVQRCRKQQPTAGGRGYDVAECVAYAGILKMHTAAMITSLHPPDAASATAAAAAAAAAPLVGKQAVKRRASKTPSEPTNPSSAARALTWRGLDYLADVVTTLGGLGESTNLAGPESEAGAAALVVAAVKAWARAKNSCHVSASWVEGEGAGDRVVSPGRPQEREWSGVSVRGYRVLAELSLNLALVRERIKLGRIVERIPSPETLVQVALDSFLRVTHAHLGSLGSAAGECHQGMTSGNGARKALEAAEQILDMFGELLPSQAVKRVGTGWFGLGTSLLDGGDGDAGLEALVRGCRLLENWMEGEVDACDDDDPSSVSEILHSVQLDLRLAKLSLALQDSAANGLAAAAAIRALAFCPAMWSLSPEGSPGSSASALALVERFVACGRGSPSGSTPPSAATGVLESATADRIAAYLSGDGGLPSYAGGKERMADGLLAVLRTRGVSPAAIVWALIGACRVYRSHLPRCFSEGARHVAGEEEEEGQESGALSECVEGHRQVTQAILDFCENCREEGGDDERRQADAWEAHARLLAARFEQDLHLAEVSDHIRSAGDYDAARPLADLRAGVHHAESGAAAASRLGGESSSSGSPVAAAASGVFACVRAVLLRSAAEHDDDVKKAMRQGVNFFDQAVRGSDWAPVLDSPANLGPTGVQSVFDHLSVLEAHYTLHGDASRRAKVSELRLVLADRTASEGGATCLPQGAAASAAALTSICTAFQSEGIPGLGPIYGAAADEAVSKLASPGEHRAQATAGDRADDAGELEAVQVAADIFRGMCLAEKNDGAGEGESVLLESRRAVSDLGSRAVSPATAAYLASVASLGLSWIYHRDGRLVEAMGEVRQVMRLCRTWAPSGGPFTATGGQDKQVVALSAEKGDCVHDEGSSGPGATSQTEAEEGIGAETAAIEDTIGCQGAGDDGRERTGVALGSSWIPVYLEGLTRMGRLWRERGVASKASLTLRQGCVMSESLHAARFLRRCLVQEIEVAAGKHQFDRADRLLRASQDLWRHERQELISISSEDSALTEECAGCYAPAYVGAVVVGSTPPPATKRTESKRGARKPGARAKPSPATAVAKPPPSGAACVRCSELAVNAAELAVVEASLLRKRGSFAEALAACERGQDILSPLLQCAGEPASWNKSLSFARVSAEHGPRKGKAEGRGLGWRAAETLAVLQLQQGRVCCLLGNASDGAALLHECSAAEGATALVRATALYRIGRMSLDGGDAAGAKLSLERAEVLSRAAGAPKLVRKVRRVLAVAMTVLAGGEGLGSVGVDGSWRVAALSSLSIGVTHCNQVTHASARSARKAGSACNRSGVSAGLQLFDVASGSSTARVDGRGPHEAEGYQDVRGGGCCLEDAVASDLRAEWPIVSLCLAPGEGACKRLLLTRLVRGRPPLTVSVPLSPEDTQLLDRWRRIMEENRDSLRGHSAEEAAEYGNDQKARWWDRRAAVDEMVGGLLRDLEERWLEAHGLAAILLGDVVDGGLRMRLEGVGEFAAEKIHAARRPAAARIGGKGESRPKGGKRAREAATGGGEGAEAKHGLGNGLFELVRVCARGGEVMGEEAWCAVVRTALSGTKNDAETTEIAREIHQKVQAAFAEEGLDIGSHGPVRPSATCASTAAPSPSLDIEEGRSCTGSRGRGAVEAAPPSSVVFAGSSPSLDASALSKMKVADLRRELSARGVSMAGLKLKADLLTRLAEVVRQETATTGREETKGGCALDLAEEEESRDRKRVEAVSSHATPDELDASGRRRKARANSSPQEARRAAKGESGEATGVQGGGVVDGTRTGGSERQPLVLVLDEELQAIPWEGLPCLRGRAVTRVPAVPFVFAALATRWDGSAASEDVSGERSPSRSRSGSSSSSRRDSSPASSGWTPSQDGVRLDRGYYVLDPEANLPHTRKQLGPLFKGIEQRFGWSGVQGKAPSEETMMRALEEVDIFAYCGHGAGELLVGREAVAGLTKCAAAVLMGCSSGRLKGYGDFEPMGMATSYLMGGSPAVVANLWDVTDKDIDRFSMALFEAFLGRGGEGSTKRALTLAHAVAQSRSECKMPFVIGYAPVCYGIPVTAEASSS